MVVAVQDRGVYGVAFELASGGIPVFPCVPGTKRPLTRDGFRGATTDPERIGRWECHWPQANLAIPTGLRSGLLVIDLDRKDGRDGFATLASLELELGPLPVTCATATPNGGEHRWFQMPTTIIRNSAGLVRGLERNAPGFDVRGEGGYVLSPPSRIGERQYRCAISAAFAALPAAWITALVPPVYIPPSSLLSAPDSSGPRRISRWAMQALRAEARALAETPPGGRNDRLWRAAAALGGLVHTGAIDADDIRRALRWACSTWLERTPRKDEETLTRGLTWGQSYPRVVQLGSRDAAI